MNIRTTAFKPDPETDVAIPAGGSLDSSLLSIGDMARTFGVSLRTLRFLRRPWTA